jgi:hypothetical protein
MKRNVVLEAQILKAIEILGEATEEEIINQIKEQFQIEIDAYEFMRNMRRWIAKKCITVTKINGEAAYKFRDVPSFFKSLQMYQMKGITAKDAEAIVAKLEVTTEAEKAQVGKGPLIGGYLKKPIECTFETLDTVAGGDSGQQERLLVFPKRDGKPYIRGNWLSGMMRDNARIIGINETFMRNYVGVSDSQPLDAEIKVVHGVKVAEGIADYETIPAGTQFTMRIRFPFKGSCIRNIEDFKEFFTVFEDAPLRGLGAYAKFFGGRIKLVEVKELN